MSNPNCEQYYLPGEVDKLHDELFSCYEVMKHIMAHDKKYDTAEMRKSWEDILGLMKEFEAAFHYYTVEYPLEPQN